MISRKVVAAYGALAVLVFVLTYSAVHATFVFVRTERAKVHPVETKIQRAPLPATADPYTVELIIPAGEITLASTSSVLLDARQTYNHADLYAELKIDDEKRTLQLIPNAGRIDQYDLGALFAFSELVNRWDIGLSDAIPLDLSMEMGMGEAHLDLSNLQVRTMDVSAGTGDLRLNLTGVRSSELEGVISGGVGTIDIMLPGDVGVDVTANRGVGDIISEGLVRQDDHYVNPALDRAPVRIRLEVDVGVGDVTLRVAD